MSVLDIKMEEPPEQSAPGTQVHVRGKLAVRFYRMHWELY